jgi:hypothetical protein
MKKKWASSIMDQHRPTHDVARADVATCDVARADVVTVHMYQIHDVPVHHCSLLLWLLTM